MHGCPPDEIEAIARHLLVDRGLHTTVKLNPTLLGRDRVLEILHDRLGYHDIRIADAVFHHDLQYGRAVRLIRSLTATAHDRGLHFGVKLSNTLAMGNHRGVLPGQEMYMSGRALYPVTMALFHRLATELGTGLSVSFSAGADALNLPAILAAGARPVTVVSDLLKPGGYARFAQYLDHLEAEMARRGAASLAELPPTGSAAWPPRPPPPSATRATPGPTTRTTCQRWPPDSSLFDCITAPCVEQCAIAQDVPGYAWQIARGDPEPALRPSWPGTPCRPAPATSAPTCARPAAPSTTTRSPWPIRALKRFAAETGRHGHRGPAAAHRRAASPSSAAGRRAWPPPACWPSTACP